MSESVKSMPSNSAIGAELSTSCTTLLEHGDIVNTNWRKLSGYDFYREVLGSPKFVVGPMVDQSELPWRILSRRYGAQLVYTPMISAKMYAEGTNKTYRLANFDTANGEEGSSSTSHPLCTCSPSAMSSLVSSINQSSKPSTSTRPHQLDRPLIVQFCANDPQHLLNAAKLVEPYCDAVDINFGCPQDIARRGRYGSFLQDEWELIYELIDILHKNLSIPVTAKFRVFPDVEKTVAYAKMMERAGAQILSCHGRIREQRGQKSGLADWSKIRAVKSAVSVPVFANGNILFHEDIQRCLDATGCDAVMSAEGNLYNPAIFLLRESVPHSTTPSPQSESSSDKPSFWTFPNDPGVYIPHTHLALEYLSIVRSLNTRTALSAVKGHLFKLMRPGLVLEKDLRERLGKVTGGDGKRDGKKGWEYVLEEYEKVIREVDERMKVRIAGSSLLSPEELVKMDSGTGLRVLPPWLAQPYFRPLPGAKAATTSVKES